jgi:hypothetical protein
LESSAQKSESAYNIQQFYIYEDDTKSKIENDLLQIKNRVSKRHMKIKQYECPLPEI